jgi:ketosteroid isomerase-like protein
MKTHKLNLSLWQLLIMLCIAPIQSSTPKAPITQPTSAEELFSEYVNREKDFDGSLVDLYADDALIRNTRRYADGTTKILEIPAPEYKALIQKVLPLAQARGDYSTYTNVTYTPEGERIRIKATRYSELKKYESPLSLLVGKDASSEWKIYEELSESQP